MFLKKLSLRSVIYLKILIGTEPKPLLSALFLYLVFCYIMHLFREVSPVDKSGKRGRVGSVIKERGHSLESFKSNL